MGHSGIYKLIESGRRAAYYTHWGAASPFSIFSRLQWALDLKEGEHADKSLIDIMSHMGDDGEYHFDLSDYIPMFELLSNRERRNHERDFESNGYLEMRVTLNMDTDTAFLEHNPRYSHYKYVGNYYIPISQGLDNLNAVRQYAERAGIEDVRDIADAFHRHTGMDEVYARANRLWEDEDENRDWRDTTSAEFRRSSTEPENDMER